jgi:hypothetical protein
MRTEVVGAATCKVNARAQVIDYYFIRLRCARSRSDDAINDLTVLPSAAQPSGHVALTARFTKL